MSQVNDKIKMLSKSKFKKNLKIFKNLCFKYFKQNFLPKSKNTYIVSRKTLQQPNEKAPLIKFPSSSMCS